MVLQTSPGSYVLGTNEEKTEYPPCVVRVGRVAFPNHRQVLLSGEALIQSHDHSTGNACWEAQRRGKQGTLLAREDPIV